MAQFAGERQPSAALEEVAFIVSPTLTVAPAASFSPSVSHPSASKAPQFVFGHWVTHSEPATDSVTVTTTRAPEASFAPPPSQGFVTLDTHPVAASLGLGSLSSGQSVPLASGPSSVLQFSIPNDRTPEV